MRSFNKSINAKSSRNCTGCGVCTIVCPVNCINIKLDKDGFYKAYVDENKCINCGKCQKVCYKFQEEYPFPYYSPQKVYIGYHKDERIRLLSSSGGVATALFETAIENGYNVIGVELDYEEFKAKHIIISNKKDLFRIIGSKYIQSCFHKILPNIKKYQKYVIIGTPCQIGAFRKAINSMPGYEDIILIDLRCAGVVGYNAFNKFINYLYKINNSGIKKINMRDKTRNWPLWGMKVIFKDGKIYYKDKYSDPLLFIFRTRKALQDVCLDCEIYKKMSHADLRLEDAWAYIPNKINEDYMKGLSQITIYTKKGEELFNKAKDKIVYKEVKPPIVRYKRPKNRDYYLLELLRTDLDLETIVKLYKKSLTLSQLFKFKINYFMLSSLLLPLLTRIFYTLPLSSFFREKIRKSVSEWS